MSKVTLEDVKAMTKPTIFSNVVAGVIGASESRMHEYGKRHELPWTTIVIGNRVHHSREQFIECLEAREKKLR